MQVTGKDRNNRARIQRVDKVHAVVWNSRIWTTFEMPIVIKTTEITADGLYHAEISVHDAPTQRQQ